MTKCDICENECQTRRKWCRYCIPMVMMGFRTIEDIDNWFTYQYVDLNKNLGEISKMFSKRNSIAKFWLRKLNLMDNKDKKAMINREYGQTDNGRKTKRKAVRKAMLKSKYGITPKAYDILYNIQDGKCAICGKDDKHTKRRLCVDHNHKTGKIRELLCTACNTGIGSAKENPYILVSMIKYLKRYKK